MHYISHRDPSVFLTFSTINHLANWVVNTEFESSYRDLLRHNHRLKLYQTIVCELETYGGICL